MSAVGHIECGGPKCLMIESSFSMGCACSEVWTFGGRRGKINRSFGFPSFRYDDDHGMNRSDRSGLLVDRFGPSIGHVCQPFG